MGPGMDPVVLMAGSLRIAHGTEASDAPERQRHMQDNGGPEANGGQLETDARVNEHRHCRHVVEQHGRDDAARGPTLPVIARQPAGEAQRQQRRPGHARHD